METYHLPETESPLFPQQDRGHSLTDDRFGANEGSSGSSHASCPTRMPELAKYRGPSPSVNFFDLLLILEDRFARLT